MNASSSNLNQRLLLNLMLFCLILVLQLTAFVASSQEKLASVHQLKITTLSTMLADQDALGEWGFAALVEADGHRLLFDTGAHPDTVILNARSMNIDLSGIQEVVLSHNHDDHTGGLTRLRTEFKSKNPHAFETAYVAPQIFWPRFEDGKQWNNMQKTKEDFVSEGGRFEVHSEPFQIIPGVWFTGSIPRKFPEHNYPPGIVVRNLQGTESEDNVPEDAALIFNTEKGLVILTGCGHAGVVNIATYGRQIVRPAPIEAIVGGLHLFNATDSVLKWTASQLREFQVGHLLGAHCTGIEAVFQLRSQMGLARSTAIVAAVGSSYTLEKGLDAGGLGLAK